MKLIMESWRKFLKKKLISEDLSTAAMAHAAQGNPLDSAVTDMEKSFENRTLVFFDLETMNTINSMPGDNFGKDATQITQIAAFAYPIVDLDTGMPEPSQSYLKKINLNPEVLDLQQFEQNHNFTVPQGKGEQPQARSQAEEAAAAEWKRLKRWGTYYGVDGLLKYTNHDLFKADEANENLAIKEFFNFLQGLNKPILVAHNLINFDRKEVIKRAQLHGIDSSTFEGLDVFDTLVFANDLYKIVLEEAHKLKDPDVDVQVGKLKNKYNKLSMKLANLMEIFSDGGEQLHTADDDTLQLVKVFYGMYRTVKDISKKYGTKPEFGTKVGNKRKQNAVIKAIQDKLGGYYSNEWKAISRAAYGAVRDPAMDLGSILSNPEELEALISRLQQGV